MQEETNEKEKEKFDSHLPRTRCTKAERAAINAKAAQAGMTPSQYMRQVSLHGKIVIKKSKADPHLIRHLSAIGNNLNQYTKRAHLRGLKPQEQILLQSCLDKLDNVLNGLINDT